MLGFNLQSNPLYKTHQRSFSDVRGTIWIQLSHTGPLQRWVTPLWSVPGKDYTILRVPDVNGMHAVVSHEAGLMLSVNEAS